MSFPTDVTPEGGFNVSMTTPDGVVGKTFNATAVATETALWTPAAGKRVRLTGMDIAGSAAGTYIFRSNTGGAIILNVYLAANAPRTIDLPGAGLQAAAINNPITCIGPATATVTGSLFGFEE